MVVLSFLDQTNTRLKSAGIPFRLRELTYKNEQGLLVRRSPWVQVYETGRGGKRKIAQGCSPDDKQNLDALFQHLERAEEARRKGGKGLDWNSLGEFVKDDSRSIKRGLTYAELRKMRDAWVSPGGPKCKDKNPFSCLGSSGYFTQAFKPEELVKTSHLEEYALHTTESLLAHRGDLSQPLIPREYDGRGFEVAVQLINYLGSNGVEAASADLRLMLKDIRLKAGKRKAPKPRFNPSTPDVQAWLDKLVLLDEFRGWCMAMISTYGLRGHELWHVEGFAGENGGLLMPLLWPASPMPLRDR